jgi:hypothetical protein
MPIKKKMTAAKKPAAKKPAVLGPKAKLMKLLVGTLRNKAKKLGISDVAKRTKENLAQSIMLAEARKKRGTTLGKKATAKKAASTRGADRQTKGTPNESIKADRKRKALAPGRRVSKSGNVYSERRRDRSDKPGQLMGYMTERQYIEDIGDTILNDYGRAIDFSDAFYEVIDNYAIYYTDQLDIIKNLGYYDWRNNDLGIEVTTIGQVAYLALNELYNDVENYYIKNITK